MKKLFSIIVILSISLIVSCSKNKDYPAIGYEYFEHNFKYGNCDTTTNECIDIKIKTIKIKIAPSEVIKDSIEKKVNWFILSTTVNESRYNSVEELRDSLIENYKTLRKEIPDMAIGYGLERNVKVETDTLDILGLEFFEYAFYGGAHPNTVTTYSNINLESGKEIKLNEILIDGYGKTINQIGEKIFRQSKDLKPEEYLEQAGFWFEEGKFKLNENFIITKTGLKFFFNPYEIAPYVFGTTEIIIEYSKLKELIKKGSILERFIR